MCKSFKFVFCSVSVNSLGVLELAVQIGKSNGKELANASASSRDDCERSPERVGRDHEKCKRSPPRLSRFLVPEDRQSHQGDGDDPENDVFSPVLFFLFSHRCSTAYLKSWFKCCSDFPEGCAFTVSIPQRQRAHAACSP